MTWKHPTVGLFLFILLSLNGIGVSFSQESTRGFSLWFKADSSTEAIRAGSSYYTISLCGVNFAYDSSWLRNLRKVNLSAEVTVQDSSRRLHDITSAMPGTTLLRSGKRADDYFPLMTTLADTIPGTYDRVTLKVQFKSLENERTPLDTIFTALQGSEITGVLSMAPGASDKMAIITPLVKSAIALFKGDRSFIPSPSWRRPSTDQL